MAIPPKSDGHGRVVTTLRYGESVFVGDVVFTLADVDRQKNVHQGAKVAVTAPKGVVIDYPGRKAKAAAAPEPVVIRRGGGR